MLIFKELDYRSAEHFILYKWITKSSIFRCNRRLRPASTNCLKALPRSSSSRSIRRFQNCSTRWITTSSKSSKRKKSNFSAITRRKWTTLRSRCDNYLSSQATLSLGKKSSRRRRKSKKKGRRSCNRHSSFLISAKSTRRLCRMCSIRLRT